MLVPFGHALEGFIFKAFSPWGRASFKEFWLIMPLVWIALGVFLVLDFQSFWGALKMRQVPSVNPLHYGFPLLFLLSWPSRFSLTMRRLHDSGKSGRWAFAPMQAAVVSFWFVLGITTAWITSGDGSNLSLRMFGPELVRLVSDGVWPFLFNMAALVDPAQIGATIMDIVREIGGSMQLPDPERIGNDFGLAPAETVPLILELVVMTLAPVVLPLLWLAFLLLPGNPEHNRFGDPSTGPRQIATGGTGRHNPYAGLAHLAAERKAASPQDARAEVGALYRQRVLQQSATTFSKSIRGRSG